VLSALQETALAYLRRDGDAIPFWRMATIPLEDLRRRAEMLGVGRPVDTVAIAGAGSLPGLDIPSAGIAVDGDITDALRAHDPPVIARAKDGQTLLDLRTVEEADDAVITKAVTGACT